MMVLEKKTVREHDKKRIGLHLVKNKCEEDPETKKPHDSFKIEYCKET